MNENLDRAPDYGIPERIEDTLNLDINPEENQEDYKSVMEMVDRLKTMGREHRRKILKPHFTNSVKETFRKQQLAKITTRTVI